MHNRDAWQRGVEGPMTLGGKTYKHLVEFKRPCFTCGTPFSIFVTEKIAKGHADSNSFALKNCPEHRRNKPRAETAGGEEYEQVLRERDEAYELNTNLMTENAALRTRLARYELPEMLRQSIGCEAVQNTTNSALPNRMPWD